ncbi:MAG: hypothetical protein DYG89_21945 [Caldilinea sp. CFX5]|nr:hypothetical protein [Caldilinea sp. CFX5]
MIVCALWALLVQPAQAQEPHSALEPDAVPVIHIERKSAKRIDKIAIPAKLWYNPPQNRRIFAKQE